MAEHANPNALAPAAAAARPAVGKEAAWVAYVLHAFGYVTAMMWPALIGLVINYAKRGDARGGPVDSHHGWMIRTFWWGSLWQLASAVLLLWGLWPMMDAIVRGVMSGEYLFAWGNVFHTLGAATLGVAVFVATWLWLMYRVIRGMVRLAESRSVP